MLGWEFPPHISGGLGTACLGLTRGLTKAGVDVLFVVPRAYGDEDQRFAMVVGGSDVPIAAAGQDAADELLAAAQALVAGGTADAAAAQLAGMAVRMRVLAVDSPLTPYLTPEEYLERLAALGRAVGQAPTEGGAVETPGGATAPPTASSAGEGPSGLDSAGADEEARTLPFTGQYGPDLMTEVGRYARVVAEIASGQTFDVIHAHDWMTFPAAVLAAHLTGRPLVTHLHASEYDRSG
jgi:hypothetical protein